MKRTEQLAAYACQTCYLRADLCPCGAECQPGCTCLQQRTGELSAPVRAEAAKTEPEHKPSCASNFYSVCGDSQWCDCGVSASPVREAEPKSLLQKPLNASVPNLALQLRQSLSATADSGLREAEPTPVGELHAENERLKVAIRWALGEEGEFGEEPEPLAGKYRQRFWWRAELRRRAFDSSTSPVSAVEPLKGLVEASRAALTMLHDDVLVWQDHEGDTESGHHDETCLACRVGRVHAALSAALEGAAEQ